MCYLHFRHSYFSFFFFLKRPLQVQKILGSASNANKTIALYRVILYSSMWRVTLITGGKTKERLRKFAEAAVDRTMCQTHKLKHPSFPSATSTAPCRKIRAENAYLDGIKQHAINITSSPFPASWPNLAEKIYFLD